MPKFSKNEASPERPRPSLVPPAEPDGLDGYLAKTAVTAPPEPLPLRSKGRVLPTSPMPVRFPPDVKAALERLATADQRSQQQILERIAFPAILAAAARLE